MPVSRQQMMPVFRHLLESAPDFSMATVTAACESVGVTGVDEARDAADRMEAWRWLRVIELGDDWAVTDLNPTIASADGWTPADSEI